MTPTKTVLPESHDRVILYTWDLAAGETGDQVNLAQLADRTVQVTGTFDSASVALQGSLDGVNFVTLTDPQGNPLNFSSAGLETVVEMVRYARPVVTGGGGLTDLKVNLLMRYTQ